MSQGCAGHIIELLLAEAWDRLLLAVAGDRPLLAAAGGGDRLGDFLGDVFADFFSGLQEDEEEEGLKISSSSKSSFVVGRSPILKKSV